MDSNTKSLTGSTAISAVEIAEPQNGAVSAAVEKVSTALRSSPATSAARNISGTSPLLDQLVYGDNDLVGMVAYALSELNRRDWRVAYEQAHNYPPSQNEIDAFIVGEQLERRLDTYRRLAEDAIAKVAGGDVNLRRLADGTAEPARNGATADTTTSPQKGSVGKLLIYLGFLLVSVAVIAYLLRYGIDTSGPLLNR